jgi:hypothetical protein
MDTSRDDLFGSPHSHASRFEPDVGQDSDEERVLRKKALQVSRFFGTAPELLPTSVFSTF